MIKKLLGKSELLKHVLILLQGTVIAQIISVVMQLVLRRVFTVSDFGIMALYSSAVGVLAILATGRYEMAIVLPKEDKDARTITRLSIIISVLFNLFLLILLLFMGGDIMDIILEHELIEPSKVTNINAVKYLIYCIPLGVFALSVYNSLNYLLTRNKDYRILSNNRIQQAITTNGGMAGFGALKFGYFGLFYGYILGLFTSILFMLLSKASILKGDYGVAKNSLKKYSDFPLKSLPSGLINMLALQLPTFFIFGFFGAQISGLYDIITRVLNAPITMVGKSVSQVFYQKISSDINEGNQISGYILKSTSRLFLFMLIPMAIIFFFGETIFGFVFGVEYEVAGRLASYFALFFLVRFVYYSQSTLFAAARKLGVEFRQNIIFLVVQLASLIIGYYFYHDYEMTFLILSLSGTACYLIFIFTLIKTAKKIDG
jgi:O-antigen/teichoic acid export membrane protein